MPFFTTGTSDVLFTAADRKWVIEGRNKDESIITKDLPRVRFFGTDEQAADFVTRWQAINPSSYLQGDMSAGNLYLLLQSDTPFKKENEELEHWKSNYVNTHFAFVNQHGELCGLTLLGRKDDPETWFIGLVKNTQAAPNERRCVIYSSFSMESYLTNGGLSEEKGLTDFLSEIDSPLLENLLTGGVTDGPKAITTRFDRIALVLRYLNTKVTPARILDGLSLDDPIMQALFAPNPVLDLLSNTYDRRLTTAELRACFNPENELFKVLHAMPLVIDSQVNKLRIEMTLFFYKENLLSHANTTLQNKDLLKTLRRLFVEDSENQYKAILLDLITKNYQMDFLKQLLSNPAFFCALAELKAFGLTEEADLNRFFEQASKREALDWIYQLPEAEIRMLCYLFCVKGNVSKDDLQAIADAARQEPYLVTLICDMEKTKKHTIDDLKQTALQPLKRQIRIIKHQFKSDFEKYAISDDALAKLNTISTESDLKLLRECFALLQRTPNVKDAQKKYLRLLNVTPETLLLRQFLASLSVINSDETRCTLIEAVYWGDTHGLVLQNKYIKSIELTNPDWIHAKGLQERFVCAKQVKALEMDIRLMQFIIKDSQEAATLRRIIAKVENECEKIQERIRASSADNRLQLIKQWEEVSSTYRKNIYAIAYQALTAADKQHPQDVKARIHQAEKTLLEVVDPAIQSWLELSLIVIANLVIAALSFGLLQVYKHKKTGNYWFFTQTQSGEEIRALDNEVCQLVSAP